MIAFKRGKSRYRSDYSSDDMYKFFIEKYKHSNISKKVYMKILKDVYSEIFRMMIYENLIFILPVRLGFLSIRKHKINIKLDKFGKVNKNNLSVNWKKTKELWTEKYGDLSAEEIKNIKDKPVVVELNEHTDGYRLRWFWDKTASNLKYQNYYRFNATRTYDQILSKVSRAVNGINYYE